METFQFLVLLVLFGAMQAPLYFLLQRLCAKMDGIESRIDTLSTRVDTLTTRVDNVSTRVDTLADRLSVHESECAKRYRAQIDDGK